MAEGEVMALSPCTIKTLAPEQLQQIVRWYASGLSPSDVVEMAESEFNLVLDISEARLLWIDNAAAIAESVRGSMTALRQNPYYEPAFVVRHLSMLAFAIQSKLAEALEGESATVVEKYVSVFLRILERIDHYQPSSPEDSVGDDSSFTEILDRLPPSEREEVRKHLAAMNTILSRVRGG